MLTSDCLLTSAHPMRRPVASPSRPAITQTINQTPLRAGPGRWRSDRTAAGPAGRCSSAAKSSASCSGVLACGSEKPQAPVEPYEFVHRSEEDYDDMVYDYQLQPEQEEELQEERRMKSRSLY